MPHSRKTSSACVGSAPPIAESSHDWEKDARIPECLERLRANERNVISQRLVDSGLYLGEVHFVLLVGSMMGVASRRLARENRHAG